FTPRKPTRRPHEHRVTRTNDDGHGWRTRIRRSAAGRHQAARHQRPIVSDRLAVGTWNYPLHVGSIWGLPTKFLWLVTCVILMTLPVTGIWMWWQRRPTGRLGLPHRVNASRPRWLFAPLPRPVFCYRHWA